MSTMKSVLCLVAAAAIPVAARTTTGSPVERVVTLLKDLKTKAEADGKAEQQSYDKFACWCETTAKRKADAIETAQSDLRSLGQAILKYKGTVAVRTSEIAELKKQIKANEDEQAAATNLRSKESASFMSETTELKQAIAALQKAVKVLGGATKRASSLQVRGTAATASRDAINAFLEVVPGRAGLSPEHISMLSTFTQSQYAPQSESIQGILKDMYETMTSNLESSTSSEADSNREYETLIGIKQEELAVLRETKQTKEEEKAEAEGLLADTTETYDNTEKQMKTDIEFFDATKSACKAKSDEWDVRKDMRAQEVQGIDKALEILTSDEARALFASSIKPGMETGAAAFLQLGSSGSVAAAAARAYGSLKAAARKTHSLRIAALAARVQEAKAGHFDEVIKAINDMIQVLKEEGQADIDKRDQCKSEYTKQNSEIANINWLVDKNLATIDKLERLIAKRTAEKEETIASIQQTEDEIAAMEKQRTEEHEDWLHAKKEDEGAVDLLKQARAALTAFYEKNKVDVKLVQEPVFEVSEDQAPETEFSGKGSRKTQTKGIVSLMTMLIEDAENEIKNGIKSEASSQIEFEKQKAAAEKLKEELIQNKNDLEGQIARLGEKKDEEHATMDANNVDLKDEKDYLAKITPDCDWIIGSFEKRAAARTAEMEGLGGAKEALVGR